MQIQKQHLKIVQHSIIQQMQAEINGTFVVINITMPMCNFIEYTDHYSDN